MEGLRIDIDRRTIIKLGKGYVIQLTKELKRLGLKEKDRVWVYGLGDRIIISKNNLDALKPPVRKEIWDAFVSLVIKRYGSENLNRRLVEAMEKALGDYIKKYKSWWSRPILEIKW